MKLFRKLENLFAATAFAEAGEFETAREMLRESESVRSSSGNAGSSKPGGAHGQRNGPSPSKS